MEKLRQVLEKEPDYQLNIHFSHNLRGIDNYDDQMREALNCARTFALRGQHISMWGDVRLSAQAKSPIHLVDGQSVEFELEMASVKQTIEVTNIETFYQSMGDMIAQIKKQSGEYRDQGKACTIEFEMDEIGFEARDLEQLEAFERLVQEKEALDLNPQSRTSPNSIPKA